MNKLFDIFQEDDGSLPDIELDNLSGDEVILGYEIIRNSSTHISSKDSTYWSIVKEKDIPILFTDNPATKVISDDAEPFHLCFGGIKSPTGKTIPDLGLFVFQNSLALDYKMGEDWNKDAIDGLFELLISLDNKFTNMKLSSVNNIFDEDEVFLNTWNQI